MPNQPRPEARYLRCPSCRTRDDLELTEVHEEYGTIYGRFQLVADDGLLQPSEFIFEVGDPVRIEMHCARCGHGWRPRRQRLETR